MSKTVDDFKVQLIGLRRQLEGSLSSTGAPLKRSKPDHPESSSSERKRPRDDKCITSSSTSFVLVAGNASGLSSGSLGGDQTTHELEILQKKIDDSSSRLQMLMQSVQEAKEKLRVEQDNLQRARAMLNTFCALERSKVR